MWKVPKNGNLYWMVFYIPVEVWESKREALNEVKWWAGACNSPWERCGNILETGPPNLVIGGGI